jgi:two-component system response regulator YesN
MKALQDLDTYLSKTSISGKQVSRRQVSDFINCSINSQLDPSQELAGWVPVLQQHGEQLLKGVPKAETLSPDIIHQVTSFIDENYMFDIGIGQIAEQFHITPNYLSTLFHKRTGTNFMSYLKKVRMLKAKELLTDSKIQIQQVAELVGYFSTRHFARLFAEQFGCLPSEYRDNFMKH